MILTERWSYCCWPPLWRVLIPWRALNDSYAYWHTPRCGGMLVLIPWRALNDSYMPAASSWPAYFRLNTLTGIEWFLLNTPEGRGAFVRIKGLNTLTGIEWFLQKRNRIADVAVETSKVLIPWRALNDSYEMAEELMAGRSMVLIPWRALNDSYTNCIIVSISFSFPGLNTLTGIEWFLRNLWVERRVSWWIVLIPWRALNDSYRLGNPRSS